MQQVQFNSPSLLDWNNQEHSRDLSKKRAETNLSNNDSVAPDVHNKGILEKDMGRIDTQQLIKIIIPSPVVSEESDRDQVIVPGTPGPVYRQQYDRVVKMQNRSAVFTELPPSSIQSAFFIPSTVENVNNSVSSWLTVNEEIESTENTKKQFNVSDKMPEVCGKTAEEVTVQHEGFLEMKEEELSVSSESLSENSVITIDAASTTAVRSQSIISKEEIVKSDKDLVKQFVPVSESAVKEFTMSEEVSDIQATQELDSTSPVRDLMQLLFLLSTVEECGKTNNILYRISLFRSPLVVFIWGTFAMILRMLLACARWFMYCLSTSSSVVLEIATEESLSPNTLQASDKLCRGDSTPIESSDDEGNPPDAPSQRQQDTSSVLKSTPGGAMGGASVKAAFAQKSIPRDLASDESYPSPVPQLPGRKKRPWEENNSWIKVSKEMKSTLGTFNGQWEPTLGQFPDIELEREMSCLVFAKPEPTRLYRDLPLGATVCKQEGLSYPEFYRKQLAGVLRPSL